MVQLILNNSKGAQVNRAFPHTGYLGVTPVKIEGVVRTKLDDDQKPLPSSSITISVRCYESRLGKLGVIHTNVIADYTHVLWSKPHDQECADIGCLELPFLVVVPSNTVGLSAVNFQEYRVFWRVEAVVHHIPLVGVGSRMIKGYSLSLTRYDTSHWSLRTPTPVSSYLNLSIAAPKTPRLRYSMVLPRKPTGPTESVSVLLSLLPEDPSVVVRSATLIVERRIELNRTFAPSIAFPSVSPLDSLYSSSIQPSTSTVCGRDPIYFDDQSSQSMVSSTVSASSSATSFFPDTSTLFSSRQPSLLTIDTASSTTVQFPSLPAEVPPKTVTACVAGAESTHFTRDENGMWTKTLSFQWPAAKSSFRWAMGETVHTEMASVRFFIRAKVVVSCPTGTESVALAEEELVIALTNEADRQLASKFYEAEAHSLSKSKSKSVRRRKPDPHRVPSPSPNHTLSKAAQYGPGSLSSSSLKGKKPMRRPHTSAGTADAAVAAASLSSLFKHPDRSEDRHALIPLGASDGSSGAMDNHLNRVPSTGRTCPAVLKQRRNGASRLCTSHTIAPSSNAGSAGMNSSESSKDGGSSCGPAIGRSCSRTWEEDPDKTESDSWRGIEGIWSFFTKRKRVKMET